MLHTLKETEVFAELSRKMAYNRFRKSDALPVKRFDQLKPAAAADRAPVVVNMLWVEGTLSLIERLALVSFRDHGFTVNLWHYGELGGLPDGIVLRDAREIMPESSIFRYENGSLAAFSNLFRYTLLSREGGLWSDTDNICLMSADSFRAQAGEAFLVTQMSLGERIHNVNTNLIWHPSPEQGDIVDLALAFTSRYDRSKLRWGDCGPTLFNMLATTYPHIRPAVLEPEFANPIPWMHCPKNLVDPRISLPKGAGFLHAYNEMWRYGGDKSGNWPKGSIMATLLERHSLT